jgi:hypothetical protein
MDRPTTSSRLPAPSFEHDPDLRLQPACRGRARTDRAPGGVGVECGSTTATSMRRRCSSGGSVAFRPQARRSCAQRRFAPHWTRTAPAAARARSNASRRRIWWLSNTGSSGRRRAAIARLVRSRRPSPPRSRRSSGRAWPISSLPRDAPPSSAMRSLASSSSGTPARYRRRADRTGSSVRHAKSGGTTPPRLVLELKNNAREPLVLRNAPTLMECSIEATDGRARRRR